MVRAFFRIRSSGFPVSYSRIFVTVAGGGNAVSVYVQVFVRVFWQAILWGFRWLGIGLYVRFAVEPFKTMDFILKSSHSLIQAGIILKKTGIILSETAIILLETAIIPLETAIILLETAIILSETANILKK